MGATDNLLRATHHHSLAEEAPQGPCRTPFLTPSRLRVVVAVDTEGGGEEEGNHHGLQPGRPVAVGAVRDLVMAGTEQPSDVRAPC